MPTRMKTALLAAGALVTACAAAAQTFDSSGDGQGATLPVQPPGDPRVSVMSPHEGEVFHPSDTVGLVVKVDPSLKPQSSYVDAPGIITAPGANFTGTSFQAEISIPADFTGPMSLDPGLMTEDGRQIQGKPTTILVRPVGDLLSIAPAKAHFTVSLLGEKTQVKVIGYYPAGATLDVTSSGAGTTYSTRDPKVLDVDSNGAVQAVGFGTGAVTARNKDFRTYFDFTVEDPAHPLPPADVTDKFFINRDNIVYNEPAHVWEQTLRLSNRLGEPAVGPFYFVLSGLPKGVWLVNGYGTQVVEPKGTWFIPLPLSDGVELPTDGALQLHLQFRAQSWQEISGFKALIYRSAKPI